MSSIRVPTFLFAIILPLVFVSQTAAEGNIAILGGIYLPDGEFAEEDFVAGVRGGYRFGANWGIEGEISVVEADTAIDDDIVSDEISLLYDSFDTELTVGFGWRFGK